VTVLTYYAPQALDAEVPYWGASGTLKPLLHPSDVRPVTAKLLSPKNNLLERKGALEDDVRALWSGNNQA
jgi:hypothetical protein